MTRARWSPLLGLLFLLALIVPAHAQRLQGLVTLSGTITANGDAVTTDVGTAAGAGVDIRGTWTGTIAFQGTVDATNWTAVQATSLTGVGSTQTLSSGQTGSWFVNLSGLRKFRVTATAAITGTATVTMAGTIANAKPYIEGLTVSSGTLATTDDAVTLNVGPYTAAQLNLATGTWNGTIVFQGSTDGTNYVSWPLAGVTGSIATQTTTSAAASWVGSTSGFQKVRARVSAVSAGGFSVVATLVGAQAAAPVVTPGLTLSAASATTTASTTTIKATPGQLYQIDAHNGSGSDCFLQVFNVAAPTFGTTTPVLSFGIPTATRLQVTYPFGVDFGTAITAGSTTTRAGATGCTLTSVNAGYK